MTPGPLVCAHRGASAYHPDNSRAAFAAAIQIGADIIETDLRRSRELVELTAGRVALDVELKEAGYEDEVLAALDPRPAGLIVTSFLPRALAAVRALDPSVATGLILRPGRRHADPLARADGCGARAVVAHASLVGDGLCRRTLAAGRPLWVWTVNDPVRLAALMLDRAVTHVITDVPDVAIALRDAIPTSG